jgi:hypothetical protein
MKRARMVGLTATFLTSSILGSVPPHKRASSPFIIKLSKNTNTSNKDSSIFYRHFHSLLKGKPFFSQQFERTISYSSNSAQLVIEVFCLY